jgi:hypothetical protein
LAVAVDAAPAADNGIASAEMVKPPAMQAAAARVNSVFLITTMPPLTIELCRSVPAAPRRLGLADVM